MWKENFDRCWSWGFASHLRVESHEPPNSGKHWASEFWGNNAFEFPKRYLQVQSQGVVLGFETVQPPQPPMQVSLQVPAVLCVRPQACKCSHCWIWQGWMVSYLGIGFDMVSKLIFVNDFPLKHLVKKMFHRFKIHNQFLGTSSYWWCQLCSRSNWDTPPANKIC